MPLGTIKLHKKTRGAILVSASAQCSRMTFDELRRTAAILRCSLLFVSNGPSTPAHATKSQDAKKSHVVISDIGEATCDFVESCDFIACDFVQQILCLLDKVETN